jgi:predicted porin
VNLTSNFGMLRLGNFTSEAYFATADYISMHNHDTGNSEDKLYAYLGRNGNKVAYRTPEFVKGLTAEASVSLGESSANARIYDVAVNYALGSLQLGLGYEKVRATSTTGSSNQFAVRALYEAGPFIFGAYVQQHDDAVLGDRTLFRLSGMYAFGASELHLNYGAADEFSGLADSDASQATVAYNYNLSKRTKLYAFYTQVDDKKAISGTAGDFNSIAVGVRHNF